MLDCFYVVLLHFTRYFTFIDARLIANTWFIFITFPKINNHKLVTLKGNVFRIYIVFHLHNFMSCFPQFNFLKYAYSG